MSMTSPPPARTRHALGLPAGSVRAALALGVLGLLWGMLLLAWRRHEALEPLYLYLQTLMVLILAHYFAAHGKTIGGHLGGSALGLPTGSVRLLLMAGFGGLVAFEYLHRDTIALKDPPAGSLALMMVLLVGGFIVGSVVGGLIRGASGGQTPAWFQDVQAWFALLAMIGLAILFVFLFINHSLPPDKGVSMDAVESGLAAVVGFYFGSRS